MITHFAVLLDPTWITKPESASVAALLTSRSHQTVQPCPRTNRQVETEAEQTANRIAILETQIREHGIDPATVPALQQTEFYRYCYDRHL